MSVIIIVIKTVYEEDIEISQKVSKGLRYVQWSVLFLVLLATNVFFMLTFFAQIPKGSPLLFLGIICIIRILHIWYYDDSMDG